MAGPLTVGGTLTLTRGGTANTALNTGSNYALTVGNLTVVSGGSNNNTLTLNSSVITLTGTGTPLTIGGANVTITAGASTVLYNGNGATATCSGVSYYNLQLEPAGSSDQTICTATAQTLTVTHSLTIGDGTNLGGATAVTFNPTINLSGLLRR